jgi:hypothetical protein
MTSSRRLTGVDRYFADGESLGTIGSAQAIRKRCTPYRMNGEGTRGGYNLKCRIVGNRIAFGKPSAGSEGATMKYEYQTLELPFAFGVVKPQLPDIAGALNEQGREGWQLKRVILPSAQFGSSDRVVLILERAIE